MRESTIDVFDKWFERRLEAIHTSVPGIIQSYDPTKRLASVLPMVKLKLASGESVAIPPIENVPVVFPGSSDFTLHFPLKNGDGCLILFSESGIGNFLLSSGVADADDQSRFSLTDAICIPGLFSIPKVPAGAVPSDGALLRYKGTSLTLKDGEVIINAGSGLTFEGDLLVKGTIKAEGEVSAMTLVPASQVNLSTHIHPTPVGPTSPPVPGT